VLRELISRQFPESLGVLVKAFSKLLDHSVQFVRIVTGDGLGDQIFDAVLKGVAGTWRCLTQYSDCRQRYIQ